MRASGLTDPSVQSHPSYRPDRRSNKPIGCSTRHVSRASSTPTTKTIAYRTPSHHQRNDQRRWQPCISLSTRRLLISSRTPPDPLARTEQRAFNLRCLRAGLCASRPGCRSLRSARLDGLQAARHFAAIGLRTVVLWRWVGAVRTC